MARHRRPSAAPSATVAGAGELELPEHLAVCIIDDWLDPTPAYSDWEPDMVAWGRWRRARRAWCEENGVDYGSLPHSCPRWRANAGRRPPTTARKT